MRTTVSVVSVAFIASVAMAQTNEWASGGTGGVWTDASKWSLGHVPLVGENAYIADGSTVDLNGAVTPLVSNLRVGASFSGTGGLKISTGALSVQTFFVGSSDYGSLELSGTAQVNAIGTLEIGAFNAGGHGLMVIDGGSVTTPSFTLANQGIGELEMNAGQIDASTGIGMANGLNSSAKLTMTGGIINAPVINFGNSGTSTITIDGGEINTGIFLGGSNSTASAVVTINGGTIIAASFRNGVVGACSTRQNGGTVDVDQLSLALGNGTGYYSLLGGLLDANIIYRGTTATYAFNMSGGTLIANEFGQWGKNIDLKPTGGIILPGGMYNAPTYLRGDLDLGLGATIKYAIPGDKIVMQDSGTVILTGSMSVVLTSGLGPSTEFVIIDNDDADPIVGAFLGLPEGAPISVTSGGNTYTLNITYVGGDGNDVVLVYTDCPPDLNNDGFVDNGDINVFIALFLAGDIAADFNNDGFLDNGDITDFIAAFIAGC